MSKNQFVIYVFALILLLPAAGYSQTDKIEDYTVKKGDTLWDISGNELNDSFLWPKVWKVNPQIPNPDRLRPGQVVKIPLYLIPHEPKEETVKAPPPEKPEPTKEVVSVEPQKPRPLVPKGAFISSGFIVDRVDGVGTIEDSPAGRTLLGRTDIVYVTTAAPAEMGERFYIIKDHGQIRHPVTHEKMGHLIEIVGIAEMIQSDNDEPRAEITASFSDIEPGDILSPYYELTPPPVSDYYRKPDINGVIVATRHIDTHIMNSTLDVVYIDKGEKDDIEVGDIFKTVVVGKHRITSGLIQVIAVQNKTATALVRKSSEPVRVGDVFAFQDSLID